MNEKAVEVLVAAAMRGEKQARDTFRSDDGGRCAMAVLREAPRPRYSHVRTYYGLRDGRRICPECGKDKWNEELLIIHLNDRHQFDFLTIARKLGPQP